MRELGAADKGSDTDREIQRDGERESRARGGVKSERKMTRERKVRGGFTGRVGGRKREKEIQGITERER